MLVIFNSDILYSQSLLTSLTPVVQRLVDACRDRGHAIVIPETTKLEFDREQDDLVSAARSDLENAYDTLTRFGISHERQDPVEVVLASDLLGLITSSGASAELVEPTCEDLREAHYRAALHLPPHPAGNTKSDEMRDLVIWMIAVRLAREQSGALLVSRDNVHTKNRGDAEAGEVGLTRVKSIDDALEFLDVQTPAGQLFRRLMEPAWSLLANEGLPVAAKPTVLSVAGPTFEQGTTGLASASCRIKVTTETGQTLRGRVDIIIDPDGQVVTLSNIFAESGTYPTTVSVRTEPVIEGTTITEEHLTQLRQILEGTP